MIWLVQMRIGMVKACCMPATSDIMKPSQPCERASCTWAQVAYTLADRVLTPANQQVKVLDVKEARPACVWAPQRGAISSVHGPPSALGSAC